MDGAVKKISGLIFLLGALVMICGAVWVWMYILTEIAKDYGPGFAVAAVAVSAVLIYEFWDWVSFPWRAWLALWREIDTRF